MLCGRAAAVASRDAAAVRPPPTAVARGGDRARRVARRRRRLLLRRHGAPAPAQARLRLLRAPRRHQGDRRAARHRASKTATLVDRRRGHPPRDRALARSCASVCPRSPRWSGASRTSACARSARSAATSASPIPTPTPRPSSSRSTPRSSAVGAARRPRRVPIAEFVVGPYQTALGAGELLTCVRVPVPPHGDRIMHEKFAFHERPTATVACLAASGTASSPKRESPSARSGRGPCGRRARSACSSGRCRRGPDAAAPARRATAPPQKAAPVEDANGLRRVQGPARTPCSSSERSGR